MNKTHWIRWMVSGVGCAVSVSAMAQAHSDANTVEVKLPKWELGLGVGALSAPAYLGSATQRQYLAPWPYVVYRGDTLRANRDGISLGLIQSGEVKLDLSLGGTLPVQSKGTARQGMPDLPPLIELGAVAKIPLQVSRVSRTSLHLPVRYGMGVGRDGVSAVGWIVDPTIRHLQRFRLGQQSLEWGTDLTTKFQDSRYNNHYYQVLPSYASPARAAYSTAAGYGGTTLNTGIFMRRGDWVLGGFVGWANLSGARFADSPLVERKNNWFGGLALTWVLRQSSEMVVRPTIRE